MTILIRGTKIQYQIYNGYKIKELPNITSSVVQKHSNVFTEIDCLKMQMQENANAIDIQNLIE